KCSKRCGPTPRPESTQRLVWWQVAPASFATHNSTLNQRVVGSSPTGGIDDKTRPDAHGSAQVPSLSVVSDSSSSGRSARHRAPADGVCAPKRLLRATESATGDHDGIRSGATGALPADPDLAAVVAAWDRLPEAVKAGIVAMVQAAASK